MNFVSFTNYIKENSDNIFVIKGDDNFLIEKSIHKILEKFKIEKNSIDFQKISDEDFNINKLMNYLEQIPFFSEKKIIMLKNIKKLNEDEKKRLTKYTKQPNVTTILICVAGKSEDFKFIKDAIEVECDSLPEKYIKKYVISELHKNETSLTDEALDLLIKYCNFKMQNIESECYKLSNMFKGKIISKTDVENNINKNLEYSIFEITKNLSVKNIDTAITIIKNMLELKVTPSEILNLISVQFRRMFYVKTSDLSNEEISKILKIKPYAIKILKSNANNFSQSQLMDIVENLLKLDFDIKSGKMPVKDALYYCIFLIGTTK